MTLFAGVDLGGTKIQAVVVDGEHVVGGSNFSLTPRNNGPAGVLDAIAEGIRAALVDAGATTADLVGIGLGSPGQIDSDAGTVSHAGNLPHWTGVVPVAGILGSAFDVPVELRNDVQAGMIAEARLGAGREFRSMLGVFCGTGVGGGIVIDGHLWRGRGAAGEVGHMIVKPGGAACPCGRRGCLEAYAGRAPMERAARRMAGQGKETALFDIMKLMGRAHATGEVWAAALDQGDPVAGTLIERNVEAMGVALASAVNLMDMDAIIVGGGLGLALGQPYVDRVFAAMLPRLVFPDVPVAVRLAGLGELAGALGAALAVESRLSTSTT